MFRFFILISPLWLLSAFVFSATAIECDSFGTCSQKCYVYNGDTRCYCVDGFRKEGNRSCVLEEPTYTLVYTTTSHIKHVKHDSKNPTIIPTSARPNFITNDVRSNVVYWTSTNLRSEGVHQQAVYKSNLNRSSVGRPEVIVDLGVFSPGGIAFDWITGNLYFADYRLRFIAVCALKPSAKCAVILEEKANNPMDLAVHPNQGIMFWTAWGKEKSIQTAGMDGKRPTTLVNSDLYSPKSITVDEANSRIYWVESYDKIESCKFDGSDRQDIKVSNWGSRKGIDILGDMIYWSDDHYNKITISGKFTGWDDSTEFLTDNQAGESVKFLNIIHHTKQPIIRANPCVNLNCPYICVLSAAFAECVCPSGMIKAAEDHCLDDDTKPKLLAAQKNSLLIMPIVNTIGKNDFQTISLPAIVKDIKAIVYNPRNKTVIFADTGKILEYNLESEQLSVLVEDGISSVIAMEIDFIAENLIWIDAGKKMIEVMSLRTRQKGAVFRFIENARDILFVPEQGTFFVSKTGKTGSQEIHKIVLGEDSNNTLFYNLGEYSKPIKLSYNREMGSIVLTSANKTHIVFHRISTDESNDGQQRTVLLESSYLVSDLIAVENQIFFVDQTSEMKVITSDAAQDSSFILQKIGTKFEESRKSTAEKIVLGIISGENDLEHLDHIINNHDCSPENIYRKACSHICLPTGINMHGKCWCPARFHLGEDELNCVAEQDNISNVPEVTDKPNIATTEASGNSGIGYVVVFTVLITLCVVIIGLVGLYWWKYRSIPLITATNMSNL